MVLNSGPQFTSDVAGDGPPILKIVDEESVITDKDDQFQSENADILKDEAGEVNASRFQDNLSEGYLESALTKPVVKLDN